MEIARPMHAYSTTQTSDIATYLAIASYLDLF